MNLFLGKMASWIVLGYQNFISPFLPPSCRFYPTCSEYSRVSFVRHGFLRGFWLSLTRLLKCNPWHPGGFDPVPPLKGEAEDTMATYLKGKKRDT